MSERKIRVLMAKIGLDGHDRGVKVVARGLRDAGFEVIYTGLHRTAEEVVEAALQEDVDFLGVSILSGAHMALVPPIIDLLQAKDAEDIIVCVGGVIPPEDGEALKQLGVAAVFDQDSSTDDIVAWMQETSQGKGLAIKGN